MLVKARDRQIVGGFLSENDHWFQEKSLYVEHIIQTAQNILEKSTRHVSLKLLR